MTISRVKLVKKDEPNNVVYLDLRRELKLEGISRSATTDGYFDTDGCEAKTFDGDTMCNGNIMHGMHVYFKGAVFIVEVE